MYQLTKNVVTGENSCIHRLSDNSFIPINEANADYQQFKKDLADGAEFTDKDGYSMNFGMAGDFDLYNPIPAENT